MRRMGFQRGQRSAAQSTAAQSLVSQSRRALVACLAKWGLACSQLGFPWFLARGGDGDGRRAGTRILPLAMGLSLDFHTVRGQRLQVSCIRDKVGVFRRPRHRFDGRKAALAQPVEHIIRNDGVACSSHASGTTFLLNSIWVV